MSIFNNILGERSNMDDYFAPYKKKKFGLTEHDTEKLASKFVLPPIDNKGGHMIEEVHDFKTRSKSIINTSKKKAGITCECPICMEFLKQPVKLKCSHVFCLNCINRLADRKVKKCPMCRGWIKIEKTRLSKMDIHIDRLVNIEYMKQLVELFPEKFPENSLLQYSDIKAA
jgi:hypothetical protein